MATPELLALNDLVLFRNNLCYVSSFEKNELGFNEYEVRSIETGETFKVNRIQLQRPDIIEVAQMNPNSDTGKLANEPWLETEDEVTDACLMNLDDQMMESVGSNTPETPNPDPSPPVNPSRFKSVTETDLARLAAARTSQRTDRMTKWAVKVLKGV